MLKRQMLYSQGKFILQDAGADDLVADLDSVVADVAAAAADVVHPAQVCFPQNHLAADADNVIADATEADAVQPARVHSAQAGTDDAAANNDAAEADTVQPANADATGAVLSLASDALLVSMDLAHQANFAPLHQVIDGDEQFVTSEGQEFRTGSDSASAAPKEGLHMGGPLALDGQSPQLPAAAEKDADAQSAAPEEGAHSAGLWALDQESVQPSAAAEQLADVQTAMPQSSSWAEDSCEEDWCVADDYFSTPLPWKQPQQAASGPMPAPAAAPAAIAASASAAAGRTAMAASDAGGSSTHTAVVSLGRDEDRSSAAAAAGTAEEGVFGSQPTDTQTAVSHGVEEDCKEDEEEEAQVNTSLGYSAFVTDSLLGRMEQQASCNGGSITALGKHCLLCLLQL